MNEKSKEEIKELFDSYGFSIVSEDYGKEVDLNNYKGWILLKSYKEEGFETLILVTSNYHAKLIELSGDKIPNFMIHFNGGVYSLYITPEIRGTIWEIEEFQEMFIEIFDKYTSLVEGNNKAELEIAGVKGIKNIGDTWGQSWEDPYKGVILGGPRGIGVDFNDITFDSIINTVNSSDNSSPQLATSKLTDNYLTIDRVSTASNCII